MTTAIIDHAGAKTKRRGPSKATTARMLAVQSLYQAEILGLQDTKTIIDEYRGQALNIKLRDIEAKSVDDALLRDILLNAWAQAKELDDMISAVLSDEWRLERMDAVLRAILRAGMYELANHTMGPAKMIIRQYVRIAESFFSGKIPGAVNAMLDKAARILRENEFDDT